MHSSLYFGAPFTLDSPRPSTFAPATVGRGSGPSGEGPSGEGSSRPTLGPLDVSHMFEVGADVVAFTRTHMQEWMERGLEQFVLSTAWGVLDQYGYSEGDSMRVLGSMTCEICRLYLMDDITWADVPENQRLAIATRLAAKYGPVSVQHQNAERHVEIRREKNVMVTNPFEHQGFAGFRARFKKTFGIYPLPKHTAFGRAHGMKRVFEFMENGRDIPDFEVGGPSIAEAGGDDLVDDDFAAEAGGDGAADDDFAAAAATGVAAASGTGDGVDDDALTDPSEGLSGAELEENEHGLTPQHEQHAEDRGDDEDDTVYTANFPWG
ncbi:hypothetical protein R1sor_003038 [Riccia sorocarpa]|uniref:Uncharacterized protein n=1 Tax=Riccia sorocarpa TaxID=122646 RepID=A0ABD3H4L9_9MARC